MEICVVEDVAAVHAVQRVLRRRIDLNAQHRGLRVQAGTEGPGHLGQRAESVGVLDPGSGRRAARQQFAHPLRHFGLARLRARRVDGGGEGLR
nr:hypothetical protein [Arthrobacter sp. A2-55]